MNFGLPIVGSNFGHVNRIIQSDDTGIAVDPESPEQIADAIFALLTDREMYIRKSNNGKLAAKTKYRWELMEQKLTTIYAGLMGD
jgi:glycosyltransferase involved in cell wall biosynthesis